MYTWHLYTWHLYTYRQSGREKAKESIQESSVETILVATDRLFASHGDAGEMVRQARVLGQATAQLIQAIKVRHSTEWKCQAYGHWRMNEKCLR